MFPMNDLPASPELRLVELDHGWIAYLDDQRLASFDRSRETAQEHVMKSAQILDSVIVEAGNTRVSM
jgi:hypothetical protein